MKQRNFSLPSRVVQPTFKKGLMQPTVKKKKAPQPTPKKKAPIPTAVKRKRSLPIDSNTDTVNNDSDDDEHDPFSGLSRILPEDEELRQIHFEITLPTKDLGQQAAEQKRRSFIIGFNDLIKRSGSAEKFYIVASGSDSKAIIDLDQADWGTRKFYEDHVDEAFREEAKRCHNCRVDPWEFYHLSWSYLIDKMGDSRIIAIARPRWNDVLKLKFHKSGKERFKKWVVAQAKRELTIRVRPNKQRLMKHAPKDSRAAPRSRSTLLELFNDDDEYQPTEKEPEQGQPQRKKHRTSKSKSIYRSLFEDDEELPPPPVSAPAYGISNHQKAKAIQSFLNEIKDLKALPSTGQLSECFRAYWDEVNDALVAGDVIKAADCVKSLEGIKMALVAEQSRRMKALADLKINV